MVTGGLLQLLAYDVTDIFLNSPTTTCYVCGKNNIIRAHQHREDYTEASFKNHHDDIPKQLSNNSIYYKLTDNLDILDCTHDDGVGCFCSYDCAYKKINEIRRIIEMYDDKPCDICKGICQKERYCVKRTFVGKVWMPMSKKNIVKYNCSIFNEIYGNYCTIECAIKSYAKNKPN